MKQVNYKITKYSSKLPHAELDEAVRRGFEIWEKHTDFKFIQVEQHQNISLEFIKDHKIFESMKIQAFLDSPDTIIFNDKFFWSLHGEPKQFRNDFGELLGVKTSILPRIVAHEFGHVIGLEHTSECDDLMCHPLNPDTFTLSENDLKRIRRL